MRWFRKKKRKEDKSPSFILILILFGGIYYNIQTPSGNKSAFAESVKLREDRIEVSGDCEADIDDFQRGIAEIESGGDYSAINYNDDYSEDGLYFRALGKYQMMNFREDTRSAIHAYGNPKLLYKIDQGGRLTPEEVLEMYPPEAQEMTARKAKLRLLELAAQDGYSGREQIDWAAQMWFGGEGATKDAQYTDSVGTTVEDYGDRVADYLCVK